MSQFQEILFRILYFIFTLLGIEFFSKFPISFRLLDVRFVSPVEPAFQFLVLVGKVDDERDAVGEGFRYVV